MDSDFREKAKELLRKQTKRFEGGGAFFDWTDQEREIWRQINELGPIDRSDLHLEAFKDLLYINQPHSYGIVPSGRTNPLVLVSRHAG